MGRKLFSCLLCSYCFVEKLSISKMEAEGGFRLEMEDIWDGTHPITADGLDLTFEYRITNSLFLLGFQFLRLMNVVSFIRFDGLS